MTEQKDQVQAEGGEGQSNKKLSFDELYDKGFEEVVLMTEQENAAKGKAQKAPEAEDKKDQGSPSGQPYKVLKVGGKEVPVASEEELIALAQKGADYTKKTQALADDRRAAEAELKSKENELAAQVSRATEFLDRLVAAGVIPEKIAAAKKAAAEAAGDEAESSGKVSEEDEAIYKEFQMDPSNAYPHEKNIVRTLSELRRELQDLKLERAQAIIDDAISAERENFPYEDIKNDQGEDITQKQIGEIMLQKRREAGIEKPSIKQVAQWAREAVRSVHDLQRKPGPISDDMDPEEFAKAHPKLAAALKGKAVEQIESDAAKAQVPPSIRPAPRPSDLTKRPKANAGQRKSLDDFLEEGFNDPDTIKALGG